MPYQEDPWAPSPEYVQQTGYPYTYMDPSFPQISPMQTQPVSGGYGGGQGVIKRQQNPWAATSIYENLANQPIYRNPYEQPGGVYGPGPQAAQPQDTWRYGSPSDVRMAQYGGGGGGGAPGIPAGQAPLVLPKFEFDKKLDLPDYKPPEEDPMLYKRYRQEAMGRGEREIRNRAQEAILSSKSIDNPQARKQFINAVLSGVGQGMESVAAGAGREARGLAGQKRAEQMQIYNAKYKAKSTEAMSQYEQDFKTALLNYQAQMTQAEANRGALPSADGVMQPKDPYALPKGSAAYQAYVKANF